MSERAVEQPIVNVPHEIILGRQDARLTDEVDVRFTSDRGDALTVPAYQASDGTIRVRFAPPHQGSFDYEVRGLDGFLGTSGGRIEVQPYEGSNTLFLHGRPRVAMDRRHLEHRDGTPFTWLGDTWWMGLGTRLRWPDEFTSLLEDRVAKGFSVVQIVAGPLPDFPATAEGTWHRDQANEAGWPWLPDWEAIDPAYYDAADRKIRALAEAGIVPCIVGMWGWYLTMIGEERARLHWRNLVARYAAFPVVFCIAGEVNLPPRRSSDEREWATDQAQTDAARARQLVAWADLTTYVQALDPFDTLITAHPAHPDVRSLLGEDCGLDVNMIQTSHWSYHAPAERQTKAIDALLGLERPIRLGFQGALALTTEAVAMEPAMPVINAEPCYEGIMGGNWQDVQRFLFWTGMTSGLAGYTYGANGIWQMDSAREPLSVKNAWGAGTWESAMHYPGSRQVGLGRQFLERLDWSQMQPDDAEAPEGRIGSFALAADHRRLYYLPTVLVEERLQGMRGLPIPLGANARATARFVDPRTLDEYPIDAVRPSEDGSWTPPNAPSLEDWLLLIDIEPA
jgi:hypothetical protein